MSSQIKILSDWATVNLRLFRDQFQKDVSIEILPDFSNVEQPEQRKTSKIVEFIDGSDVFDTSSGTFAFILPELKVIPDRFKFKEPPTIEIQDDMITFNEELLSKIRTAFKPATLDFSEECQPFLVYDDYMLFKADQAVCIHLFD